VSASFSGLEMRRGFKLLFVHVLVTAHAHIGSRIIGNG
jgi:hypothetical protein